MPREERGRRLTHPGHGIQRRSSGRSTTLAPCRRRTDVRRRGGLARDRGGRRRPPARGRRLDRTPASRATSVRSPGSSRSTSERLLAASTDSVGSKLVLARRARKAPLVRRRPGRARDQRRPHDGRRAALLPRLRRRERRSTPSRSRSSSKAPPTSAAPPAARSSAARRRSFPGSTATRSSTSAATVVGVVDRAELIDGSRAEPGDVVVGLRLGGHPRERLLARPPHRRGRPVRCRPAAPADASATSTTCARSVRAPTFTRSRTSPAAGSPAISRGSSRTASARSSSRPPGSGRRSSRGSPTRASGRTSCVACSTSGIGYCAVVQPGDVGPGDLVIGRLEAGVDGVEWSDA